MVAFAFALLLINVIGTDLFAVVFSVSRLMVLDRNQTGSIYSK